MSSILRSKLFAYGVVSTGVAAALVSHVYNQRQNFYSAAVQMHRSTGSAIVSRRCSERCRSPGQRGMLADHRGVRYDVELPVGVVDLGKLCGFSVYTRRISVQGHLLRNFEDYRGRGMSSVRHFDHHNGRLKPTYTSVRGHHTALLRQIMVLRDGIYASIDLFPVSNEVVERWQWSVPKRSLN
jgi:hypothetical protein